MLQFLEHKFNNDHDTTIGVEFGSKYIKSDEREIKLQVWDTVLGLLMDMVGWTGNIQIDNEVVLSGIDWGGVGV